MKRFRYKAKKGPEETVQGTLTAESQDEAIDKINEMGLLPVDLTEEKEDQQQEAPAKQPEFSGFQLKKVKAHDLAIFSKQLATLVKSGVPILRSLDLISKQSPNPYFKKAISDMHEQIRHGEHLSSAMAGYRDIFSIFDIAMIQAGESAGKLEEALLRIAKYKEEEERVLSKVRSALAYPLFVVSMGAATVIFMLAYVIPKFSTFFKDLGQELPLPTRILLSLSAGLQKYWWVLLLLGVCIYVLSNYLMKQKSQKALLDRFMLRIPQIGSVVLKSELVRFSRALELLLRSGVQLLTALKIAMPVVKNDFLRSELSGCQQTVQDGGYLSEGLRASGVFPAFVCQLASIGEESGRLDDSLGEIAVWYEQEIEEQVKVMTQLLEPLIIVLVGFVLGLMIIAVLLPIFSINTFIQ